MVNILKKRLVNLDRPIAKEVEMKSKITRENEEVKNMNDNENENIQKCGKDRTMTGMLGDYVVENSNGGVTMLQRSSKTLSNTETVHKSFIIVMKGGCPEKITIKTKENNSRGGFCK